MLINYTAVPFELPSWAKLVILQSLGGPVLHRPPAPPKWRLLSLISVCRHQLFGTVFPEQYLILITYQRRIQGGRAPLFWQSQFYFFYIVYNVWKIFLKLNLDFIVVEIRGIFLEVWGCMRVCVSVWSHRPTRQISRFFYLISVCFKIVAATVFVLQWSNFEWYPRPFWSQKYIPDCRRSHLIFQNFLGRPPDPPPGLAPSALGSGLRPFTGPPFPKFQDPPLLITQFSSPVSK